jgi:hypothetical protein
MKGHSRPSHHTSRLSSWGLVPCTQQLQVFRSFFLSIETNPGEALLYYPPRPLLSTASSWHIYEQDSVAVMLDSRIRISAGTPGILDWGL